MFTRMKDIFSQNALAYINKDKNKNCEKIFFFLSQIHFKPYLNLGNDKNRQVTTNLRLSVTN